MVDKFAQAAVAANRDVPDTNPQARQDCSETIHIIVFFDGTGNNNVVDEKTSKWSNVARLYYATELYSKADPTRTVFPVYISGVGTPYNGKAADWLAKAAIWVEDRVPGMGSGAGGDRRMNHGHDMVNETLRDVLIANAKALGGTVAKYAAENSAKSFGEVNAALAQHRLIKIINLSIFGFSRGAALARAFSNQVIAKCTRKGEHLIYHNYPLRINFMGVFDTVASFGIPGQNARTPFTERELIVSGTVERCVHFIAAHEVRYSFPVDLIRKNGKMAGEWLEKAYPGVHSDVGGGYEPKAQGIDNNYARIPMRDMMSEALSSGVRMLSYQDIAKMNFPVFARRFECRPDTEAAYRGYVAACGVTSGTIEQQMTQHLKVYYSAYGTMHRRGIESAGDRSRNASKYKYVIGSKGMPYEAWGYRYALKAGKWLRFSDRAARGYAQYIQIQDWQLAAWDSTAADSTVGFVSRFIHDSKVDFLGNIEPFSYFRPRGVEESTISVWKEGGNWVANKANIAGNAAGEVVGTAKEKVAKAADATADAVHKAADAAAKAAKEAADAAQRKATEAAEFARRKADEAAAAASRAYDATAKAAKHAADAAQQRAQDAADYARQKAKEAADAANRTYDATAKAARDAADAARQGAQDAADYARRKAQEAADAAAGAANSAYDATAKAAKDAADSAQQRAQDAADYARRKAKEAEDAAAQAYDTAAKSASDATAAGKRKADELEEDVERIYESGTNWIKSKIKEVRNIAG